MWEDRPSDRARSSRHAPRLSTPATTGYITPRGRSDAPHGVPASRVARRRLRCNCGGDAGGHSSSTAKSPLARRKNHPLAGARSADQHRYERRCQIGLLALNPDRVASQSATPDELRRVATVYHFHHATGGKPRHAVMATWGLSRSTTNRWIRLARELHPTMPNEALGSHDS